MMKSGVLLIIAIALSVSVFAVEEVFCDELGLDFGDFEECANTGFQSCDPDILEPPCLDSNEDCCVAFEEAAAVAGTVLIPDCIVTGSFPIQDFSADIACKYTLWTGFPPFDGEENSFLFDPFCAKPNELLAAKVITETDEGFIIIQSIQQELFEAANDASFTLEGSIGYITELEIQTLENIAEEFPNKLLEFLENCQGGTVGSKRYIECKQLLADMKKELGEAAKIVWYTPDAFWKVQILEDIQENINHILAKFDEGARTAFTVDCSCDKGVELEFDDGEGRVIVELIGDANSADVTVEFEGACQSNEGNNCKLINEYDKGTNGNCVQVYDCTNAPGPGIIAGASSASEARAVAHGPCGKDNDGNLDDNFDRVLINGGNGPVSVGLTGGVVAGLGEGSLLVGAIGVLALAMLIILMRKRQ